MNHRILHKDKLVGYWNGNAVSGSTAKDKSGLGHDGTIIGTINEVQGTSGNAFAPTATGVIRMGDSDDFSMTNGSNDLPFTIEMLVNANAWHNDATTAINHLFKGNDGGSFFEWQLQSQLLSGNVVFLFALLNSDASALIYNTYIAPSLNKWIHIVATYDGSGTNAGIKLYYNSVIQSPNSTVNSGGYNGISVRMSNTTGKLFSQNFYGTSSNSYFNGKTDFIRLYKNVCFTQREIKLLYNQKK